MKDEKESLKKEKEKEKVFSKDFSEKNQPTNPKSDVKEKLNSLKEEFGESTGKDKKPRGKAAVYAKEEQKKDEFKKSVSGIGSMALDLLIARMPKNTPLSLKEKEQFDSAFDNLVYKYASYVERFQEETAFLLCSIMIVIPRLEFGKKKESEPDEKGAATKTE